MGRAPSFDQMGDIRSSRWVDKKEDQDLVDKLEEENEL
jgi:hypothetical protein